MRQANVQGCQTKNTKLRVLAPKVSDVKSHECLAFDIETMRDCMTNVTYKNKKEVMFTEPKFMCGSVYVDGVAHIFWDKGAMKSFILKKEYKKYWKVATNLAFDAPILFYEEISEFVNCAWKFAEYNGHKFVDSLSYAPLSVEAQGKVIGCPKLKEPRAWLRMPQDDEEQKELEEYCKRDSEVTGKFYYWFRDMLESLGGEMKQTTAQCSLELFKRKYLKTIIYGEDDEKQAFVRLSYKGGRTECFKRGVFNDVNYYDVNSLYPYVMSKLSLPDPSTSHWKKFPTLSSIQCYEGVSDVELCCPETLSIPLLHAKSPDGKLIFPTGDFSGVYTHIELKEAIRIGYVIKKVRKQLVYTHCFDDYKLFVKDLYKKRMEFKEKGDASEFIVKLMMNGSYGKLGQDSSSMTKCVHISKMKEHDTIESFVGRPDFENGWVNISQERQTPAFVHVIMASYVTAGARVHMHNLMKEYDPIYTDTDSIITRMEMPYSMELGDVKLERRLKVFNGVRPKFYMYIDEKDVAKVRAKGYPKITKVGFEGLLNGKQYRFEKMTRFKESLLRKVMFNSSFVMEKGLSIEDDKRLWPRLYDGRPQESVPIHL